MDGEVRLEVTDGVAELVLDRPAKHNAVTPAMAAAIAEHARRIDADDAIRAVLLRGAGTRAFCAGSDLNALAAYPDAWSFRNRVVYEAAIRGIRKPVVAALKGYLGLSGQTLVGFGGMIVSDPLAAWLKCFATVALMVTLVYARPY
ncbi:MAG: enoyl-CoA hydratase/isomerase family protein, partial [Elioraea tepidiphila]